MRPEGLGPKKEYIASAIVLLVRASYMPTLVMWKARKMLSLAGEPCPKYTVYYERGEWILVESRPSLLCAHKTEGSPRMRRMFSFAYRTQ